MMMNTKSLLKISAIYLLFAVAMSLTSPLLLNAIYGVLTHNWTPLISFAVSFTGAYLVASATIVVNSGFKITLLDAMAMLAEALWPWGWAIISGIAAGL